MVKEVQGLKALSSILILKAQEPKELLFAAKLALAPWPRIVTRRLASNRCGSLRTWPCVHTAL